MTKTSISLLNILKITSTPSTSFKKTEYMNMQMFLVSKVQLLDTRRLLLHWKVDSQCLSPEGFRFPHHTCVSCRAETISQKTGNKLATISMLWWIIAVTFSREKRCWFQRIWCFSLSHLILNWIYSGVWSDVRIKEAIWGFHLQFWETFFAFFSLIFYCQNK